MPDSQTSKRDRDAEDGTSEETLLQEIRDNYDFDTDAFADIREQGSIDITYIANDPWPEKEKQSRKDNERPLISIDLLNQYTNLVINEVRQHPREIKISPSGFGATAKLAELRENRVRAIQYKSDAQAAYVTALENSCQRGYGYFRVSLRYKENSFNQEICIKRIPNPDAVLFDSGCKEIDCSDAQRCFVLDQISLKDFKRQWPNAERVDFAGELAKAYPQWIKNNFLQIAEYWRVEKKDDMILQFDGGAAGTLESLQSKLLTSGATVDKGFVMLPAKEGQPALKGKIFQERKERVPSIVQYITNGVEILEKNKWLGKWIPIVPMFGKELYITEADGSKRMLMSLIRNARDAQMSYNYFQTCVTEAVGMVPRTNYLGYEGQFEGHEQEFADANKVPKPYVQVKPVLDGVTQQVLPLPTRTPFDPPVQNLELGAEAMAKAIQSTVGMYNSSVGKNDTNVKSGKAIQELDEQSDLGAFHFIDNCNRGITAGGRIVNDLISKIEVSEMEVPIRKQDGTEVMVKINQAYVDEAGQPQHHDMTLGEYDTTISVQPNQDSQREAASDFLETFLQEMGELIAEPAKREALVALSIQIKQMGPIADQMVDILQPKPGDPQQLQSQLQQLQSQVQQLSQENEALHLDRAGRVIEQHTKLQIAAGKNKTDLDLKTMELLVQLDKAELASKSRSSDLIAQSDAEMTKHLMGIQSTEKLATHDAAHEVALADMQHGQNKELAAQAAQHQSAAASQQAGHKSAAEMQDFGHKSALSKQSAEHQSAQSAQDAAQTQDTQAQAAALQPKED